jgi:hypothetical protein
MNQILKNKKNGCKVIFYPKYHCEFNFIEMIWGWLKSYHRRTCTYNYTDLRSELSLTIENRIPLSFIRKAQRKSFRYMSAYRLPGLQGAMLEYAVKKFSSHRTVPPDMMREIQEGFSEYLRKHRHL